MVYIAAGFALTLAACNLLGFRRILKGHGMKVNDRIRELVDRLIEEGQSVVEAKLEKSSRRGTMVISYVPLDMYGKWSESCKVLATMLGEFGTDLSSAASGRNQYSNAVILLAKLKSIKENLEAGFLVSLEDLVFAEAFANLMEQGVYLLSEGYYLAAGVIFRAVLEEQLRRLCDANGVTTSKSRPTIADYNTELYKAKVYTKITMQNVTTMAAIGNAAAHNDGTLTKDDVAQFRTSLQSFLEKYSV